MVLIGSEKGFAGTDMSGAVVGTTPALTFAIPGTVWHPAVPLTELHGTVVSVALVVASAAWQVPTALAKAMTSAMNKRHKVDILFSVNCGFIFNGYEAEKNCEILKIGRSRHKPHRLIIWACRRSRCPSADHGGAAARDRPRLPTFPVEEIIAMWVLDDEYRCCP